MIVTINETGRYYGMWFIAGRGMDWLAILHKPTVDAPDFIVTYRFRYYADEGEPFDGRDTKNWYEMRSNKPLDVVIANVDSIVDTLAQSGFTHGVSDPPWRLVITDGDPRTFADALMAAPFTHLKTTDADTTPNVPGRGQA